MFIKVSAQKCVGCRICELSCSFELNREFNPINSKVRIYFKDSGEVEVRINKECTCLPHGLPLCIQLCPTSAIQLQ
jgi:Fe-S-cluster-containing dehydrogenase component